MSGSTFNNNTAVNGGGAIKSGSGMMLIVGCLLSNNTVTNGAGGALFSYSGNLTVDDCVFDCNSASTSGGAICAQGTSSVLSVVNVSGSTFNNNTAATDGGAIKNGACSMTVHNCLLSNNTANGYGGAINNYKGSLKVTSSNLIKNVAKIKGGALFNYGSNIIVKFCTIIENNASGVYDMHSSGNGFVNASYNWWGSNTNPSERVSNDSSSPINIGPWLVLTITATQPTILADLRYDSDGNYHDPQYGYVTRVKVTFNTTDSPPLGTLNPTSIFTTQGSANTTFTATKSGIAHINAKVDGQIVTVSVKV